MLIGAIGIDLNGFLKVNNRFIQPPKLVEGVAQVVVRLGETGPDVDGLAIAGRGLIQPSEFLQRQT